MVETLEGRRLLSAAVAGGAIGDPYATQAVTSAVKDYGTAIRLQAGQAFNGYLGVVIGSGVDAGTSKILASINWGDGSAATQGRITVGPTGHIDVGGAHKHTAGEYAITIQVSAAPITLPGQPTPDYVVLLGTIHSQAIVAGSASGITIREPAGKSFTATVGTFQFPAPGKNLIASINWGDGTTSKGTLVSAGPVGVVLKYAVNGTHSYAEAGTYPITVTVTQGNPPATAVFPVTAIHSSAVVAQKSALSLAGTITGMILPLETPPDAGNIIQLTGKGTVSPLGAVFVYGSIATDSKGVTTGDLTSKQCLKRCFGVRKPRPHLPCGVRKQPGLYNHPRHGPIRRRHRFGYHRRSISRRGFHLQVRIEKASHRQAWDLGRQKTKGQSSF